MGDFDYSKIIWGVVIVVYFIVQWMGRKEAASTADNELQGEETFEDAVEFEQEPFNRPEMPRKRSYNRVESGSKQFAEPVAESATESKSVEGDESKGRKRFNLRDAVIMSEILNPKFKDK